MKLDVTISDTDHATIITLNFNDNTMSWTHHTGGTIEWASRIADTVTRMFPKYKLNTFGFVPSSNGGYMVAANWQLND